MLHAGIGPELAAVNGQKRSHAQCALKGQFPVECSLRMIHSKPRSRVLPVHQGGQPVVSSKSPMGRTPLPLHTVYKPWRARWVPLWLPRLGVLGDRQACASRHRAQIRTVHKPPALTAVWDIVRAFKLQERGMVVLLVWVSPPVNRMCVHRYAWPFGWIQMLGWRQSIACIDMA